MICIKCREAEARVMTAAKYRIPRREKSISRAVLATLVVASFFPYAASPAASRSSVFTVQVTVVPSCDITHTVTPVVQISDLALTFVETSHQRILQIVCHPVVPFNIVVDTRSPSNTTAKTPCAAVMGSHRSPNSSGSGLEPGSDDDGTRSCPMRLELIATVVY
jgi:hypothetical protein